MEKTLRGGTGGGASSRQAGALEPRTSLRATRVLLRGGASLHPRPCEPGDGAAHLPDEFAMGGAWRARSCGGEEMGFVPGSPGGSNSEHGLLAAQGALGLISASASKLLFISMNSSINSLLRQLSAARDSRGSTLNLIVE